MTNNRKIRSAVIGTGNMGKNHARVYSEISDLCAVADLDSTAGEDIAKKYGTAYYRDYEEMLDRAQPDAVSVAVPTRFHPDVVRYCLKKKIPTLVEKPIAENMKAAAELLADVRKSETFLMVGHIERFNPAVVKLKQIIDSGKIGSLFSVLTVRVGISPPGVPHANVLIDLGIHDVDVCNYLLNEVPKVKYTSKHKIFRHSDADSCSLHLEYSRCSAVVITNWITPIKIRRLYATGTKGFIELDYLSQKITYYSEILNTVPDGDYLEFISLLKSPNKVIYVSKKEPLKEELKYFLKNRQRTGDDASVSAAVAALKIVTEE